MKLTLGLMFALLLSLAAAADPTTRPTTDIPKDETSLAALKRCCRTFDTLDYDAALALHHYSGEKEEKFTRSYCRFAIALTQVELSIVKRFDRQTADRVMHACDVQVESDVDGSKVELDGDKATIKIKGAEAPTTLRRIDGVWKVSVGDMLQGMSDDDIKSAMEFYEFAAKALPPVAQDISSGKYRSLREVLGAVRAIIQPAGSDPKDGA